MLRVRKHGANRVDIELSGSLDADAMRAGLDDLIELSEGVSDGQMLYRIDEFALPTLGAMGVELSRLPGLFGLIGKFTRCAVLCDTAWIRSAAEVEGALFPGLKIKSFETGETAAAERWLREGDG